jgi:HPt (histidine-containing phosphotransfer) domain-containing protein
MSDPLPAAINLQAIDDLRALSPDDGDAFVREVAGIYLADAPLRLAELERSLAAGEAPVFARAAHTLKGSSANLGAVPLRGLADRLEQLGRRGELATAAPLLAEAQAEFARVRTELTRLLDLPPAV